MVISTARLYRYKYAEALLGPIPMVIPMQITDTPVYLKNNPLLPLIHYWPV